LAETHGAAETHGRALWFRAFGNPLDVLELEEGPLAPLADNHIRVRMIAAPINPSDLIPVSGAYAHRVRPPLVCGYEGVGVVIEGRGRGQSLVGQRVLPLRGAGTWQSHVDCDPAWAVVVPDDIEDHLAARAYINPLAAFLMLKTNDLRGKHILLNAAGSTCAGLLAQWALAEGAAGVTGIYRSASHLPALEIQGIVPVACDDLAHIAAAARRADMVFDAVGGGLAALILQNLQPHARFLSYGLLSGAMIEIPQGGPYPQRFHIRDHFDGLTPAIWQDWFATLWPRLRQSHMPEATFFPLANWRKALTDFETAGRLSKPLLDLRLSR
jgi:NADPH:quinone reductase-like Zn-dependent oxidoreductase